MTKKLFSPNLKLTNYAQITTYIQPLHVTSIATSIHPSNFSFRLMQRAPPPPKQAAWLKDFGHKFDDFLKSQYVYTWFKFVVAKST
jgi:hypothetical protein